jgi:hypothetical protein
MTCLRAIGGILVLGTAALAAFGLVTGDHRNTLAAEAGADQQQAEQQQAQQTETEQKQTEQKQADQKEQPAAEAEQSLRHFMRMKLSASSMILEGLAVEDFGLIKQGAAKLNEMSTAEKWRVSNDALYRNFSGDFQRVTKDLVKAAEDENLDRAALKWVDATMGCIECHRYARGMFIASAQTLDSEQK